MKSKPKKTRNSFRLPVHIDRRLREHVQKTRRAMTTEVIIALEKHLGLEEAK